MQINKYDDIVAVCNNLLYNCPIGDKALSYLNNRLTKGAQLKFGFGFFPPQDQLKMLLSFIDEETLIENNLLYEKNIDSDYKILFSSLEQHNLILPYRDVYGKIIALVGRSLLDDETRSTLQISKYKNTSFEKSKHLFGLYESKKAILDTGYVYIVEGQFDCIQAHNRGIENVVALGSSNMSTEQLILLLRYTNNIKLLLDNDEAGKLGRERILEKYGRYTTFSNLYIPSGFKDLDELLSEIHISSSEELRKSLRS
jgi:DNA primase catalytic core